MTTPTNSHYWVSIGRNRAATTPPLDSGDWAAFQDSIRRTCALWGTTTGVEVHGQSTLEGTGGKETFLLLFEIRSDLVAAVSSQLARTAAYYDQEAVCLVGGPGEPLIPFEGTVGI